MDNEILKQLTLDEFKAIGRKYEEYLLAKHIQQYLIDSGCSELNASDVARNIKARLYNTLIQDSNFMDMYNNAIIKVVDDYLQL